ncbi:hypothetical protein H311_00093, partial [Anncaliia algerae PRA109]
VIRIFGSSCIFSPKEKQSITRCCSFIYKCCNILYNCFGIIYNCLNILYNYFNNVYNCFNIMYKDFNIIYKRLNIIYKNFNFKKPLNLPYMSNRNNSSKYQNNSLKPRKKRVPLTIEKLNLICNMSKQKLPISQINISVDPSSVAFIKLSIGINAY